MTHIILSSHHHVNRRNHTKMKKVEKKSKLAETTSYTMRPEVKAKIAKQVLKEKNERSASQFVNDACEFYLAALNAKK